MYPTISHLLFDLFGINFPLPIQTFGFCVAMAFLAGGYFLAKELKRKEKEGHFNKETIKVIIGEKLYFNEIASSCITGFIVGFKLVEARFYYYDLLANPQDFILSTRGDWIGGIMIACLFLSFKWISNNRTRLKEPKEIEKSVRPYELTGNIIMTAAISGVIGAKIFSVIETLYELTPIKKAEWVWDKIHEKIKACDCPENLEKIQEIQNFQFNYPDFIIDQLATFSGLTFYGGLIFGAITVIWYVRKHKMNVFHFTDAIAPSLILAYGVGRIGCQLSGDGDWGIKNLSAKPEWISFLPDWMWSFKFPHNVIKEGKRMSDCGAEFWEPYCYELANPVWPTAFYETVMCLIIFSLLWIIRKRIHISGILFCIYLVMNGIERFFIEKIRVTSKYDIFGGITQAQIIALVLIVLGLLGCIVLYNNNKKKTLK